MSPLNATPDSLTPRDLVRISPSGLLGPPSVPPPRAASKRSRPGAECKSSGAQSAAALAQLWQQHHAPGLLRVSHSFRRYG